jgi:HAD superfamily hydrolase (TIGR01459 family)
MSPTVEEATAEPQIAIIPSFAPLSASYDVVLCDIWGVLHNGVRSFAEACACCWRIREAGGTVILVTNAPRPNAEIARQIGRLGVERDAYDAIVSSGDVTRGLLGEVADRPLYHLGPERDLSVFEGLNTRLVAEGDAEAVICTGLFDDTVETPETYREPLSRMADRRIPMICANPDVLVERGEQVVYCAGALAGLYRELGGEVTYAGKPFAPIYDLALKIAEHQRGAPVESGRVIAVGDGLHTDMKGAANAGFDSLYIASSVHMAAFAVLSEITLAELFPAGAARPVAAMTALRW